MNIDWDRFRGKTIVVTGATGFLGNRLIEILQEIEGLRIKAIVRNFGNAIRLARFPIEIIKADILNKEECSTAFTGADYVFHCAYGNKGAEEARHRVNQLGTLNLLELSKENKIAAFMFVSTIAVYGAHKTGAITEQTQVECLTDAYGKSKLEAEKLVISFGKEHQLPVVVLQPTGIYGPWAQSYGLKMTNSLINGLMPISNESKGIANLVYVDDVVQAMLKSIVSPISWGKRYIISGPDTILWETFFNSFEPLIGRPVIIRLPEQKILEQYTKSLKKPPLIPIIMKLIQINVPEAKKLLQYPLLRKFILWLYRNLPSGLTSGNKKQKIAIKTDKKALPGSILTLTPDGLAFYKSESQASSRRAEQDFGYKPLFHFKDGFELQSKWYYWYSGRTEETKSYH